MAENKSRYQDNKELEKIIKIFDEVPAPCVTFGVQENMWIYNWLKELQQYRKIGTLSELINLKK